MFDLPPPRHISTLRHFAIGTGIDKGPQSTRKLSYTQINYFKYRIGSRFQAGKSAALDRAVSVRVSV